MKNYIYRAKPDIDIRQPVTAVKENGYEILMGAIVGQAYKDYRHCYLYNKNYRIGEVEEYLAGFPEGKRKMQEIRERVDSFDRVVLNLSQYIANERFIKRHRSEKKNADEIEYKKLANKWFIKQFNAKIKKLPTEQANILTEKFIVGKPKAQLEKEYGTKVIKLYEQAVIEYGKIRL